MRKLVQKLALMSLGLVLISSPFCLRASAQDQPGKLKLDSESKKARDYSLGMLDEMEDILTEYYYDPKYKGIDLKKRIEDAKARVKTLQYNWQMYRVLVQVLMDFDDSHTRMLLPARTDHFDYGFRMQMIGDSCFIVSVKKDSDAYKQGVRPGDEIVLLGRFTPTRRDLWKMIYVLYKLDPAKILDIKIRKAEGGAEQSLRLAAKTMSEKQFLADQKAKKEAKKNKDTYEPFRCEEVSTDLLACKLYSFVVEKNDIDKMMTRALKYPKLILDLRGNGGGYVTIEQYVLSHFFDHEVKIADLVTRKKTETRMTKLLTDRRYKGELAVLVDSNSASAAEMTARVLQLEKRAKIYGDFSSGSVMTSITVPFESVMSALADAAFIKVGMSVTVADVIMRDGSRLENRGVEPDEVLQPTGLAFAQKTDPLLSYVAQKFGAPLTPEKAGAFHFLMPKSDDEDDEAESEDGTALP